MNLPYAKTHSPRKTARRLLTAAFIAVLLFSSVIPVALAQEGDEPAISTDLMDMIETLDQLLAEEHDGNLIVYSEVTPPAISYVPSSADQGEEAEEPVPPTPEEFLADLAASYTARLAVIDRYKEYDTMPSEIYNYYRFACVEAERSFYEAYEDANFEDKRYQVLCDLYMEGLSSQLEAEQIWLEDGSEDELEILFFDGYVQRRSILADAVACYELDVDGYDELWEESDVLETLDEAGTYNQDLDNSLVSSAQELLNSIGFDCGTPDGNAGSDTTQAVYWFQRSLSEDADGHITEELLAQLYEATGQSPE